jgi:microsomal dipeptidase-like Zn-dependent dipeptidase
VKGHCDTARNLPDSLMQKIADRGGLVGIGFWDAAVCDTTPAGIVAAIRHAIDLLGAGHVALGSDYDGAVTVQFDVAELAVLTQEMLRSGFSEKEIRLVMGGNVRQFLLENLPGRRLPHGHARPSVRVSFHARFPGRSIIHLVPKSRRTTTIGGLP